MTTPRLTSRPTKPATPRWRQALTRCTSLMVECRQSPTRPTTTTAMWLTSSTRAPLSTPLHLLLSLITLHLHLSTHLQGDRVCITLSKEDYNSGWTVKIGPKTTFLLINDIYRFLLFSIIFY